MKKENKNNGFEIPNNYFQNLSIEMETRVTEEQLKDKFGNKNPFSVPQNYFISFSVNRKKNKSSIKVAQLL